MKKVEVNQENKIIKKFLKFINQIVKLESDVWSDIRQIVNYISIYGFSATLILELLLLKRYGN